jgi:uroporphyrinogen-III synthase
MADGALHNLRVLVTRPAHQAEAFIRAIESMGGTAVHLPTIEIVFTRQTPIVINAELAVFTSVNAVHGALANSTPAADVYPPPLIAAIGTATEQALRQYGFDQIIAPTRNANSETLLQILKPYVKPDIKVAIIRGDSGRDLLYDKLHSLGAQVHYEAVYERKRPVISHTEARTLWHQQRPGLISVSSDLGLDNLIAMLPSDLYQALFSCPLVVNSERCAKRARTYGFNTTAVAAPPGDQGQIRQLAALATSI